MIEKIRKTLWLIVAFILGINFFMVLLILVVFGFGLSGCRTTGHSYTQQSVIDPRKQVIFNREGNQKGYLQKSVIDPRNTVQYDKNGNEQGYWQKSVIDPRKTIFHKK